MICWSKHFLLQLSILNKLYLKPTLSNTFIEIFEQEWKNFKFIDHELLNKVINSPWSLVPVFEEKFRKKLPNFLKPPENELQELIYATQHFLTLRFMIYNLKWRQGSAKLNEYPFKVQERDVYKWNICDKVVVENDKTLVLCNLQIDNQLEIRYVVLDPEFFILIEPDFEDVPLKTIRIEIKAPLKNIETQTDSRNPKKLTIGISELTDKGEEIYHKFMLHFENALNWKSVRKTIEDNKKQQKKYLDVQFHSFFDRWSEEVQDEDAI